MSSTSPPRYILGAGLGPYANKQPSAIQHFGPNVGDKVKELVAQSTAEAREAGFEIISHNVNPGEPEASVQKFTALLKERDWAGVIVGFGLRGQKEHTVLCERLLNVCRVVVPKAVIMLTNGPDELYTAIKRNFPDGSE
ncbi:hypothetical protein BAUCODRAFT_58651, partial [Baudoinia panamericana UAMH 10762]